MPNSRIKVPESAAAGESIEIRAMIMHPMENGFNFDSQGTTIPVHIITDFLCTYDGAQVVRVQLQPGLSANPYFSFYLTATRSGPVEFTWTDQDGTVTTNSAQLQVT
ncbi:MAG: thiosulfate oxidation carrier complex protein SoxZ [Steroidobacteraceae bacterium]